MVQHLGLVSVVVRDYDEAIAFYVGALGFTLIEDTHQPAHDKRWVVVKPPDTTGCAVLLARATNERQAARIGDQTGGRVFLFLYTDDFWRDFNAYRSKGVVFVREPTEEEYGTVAVFEDLHGNLWDLVQPARPCARDWPDARGACQQTAIARRLTSQRAPRTSKGSCIVALPASGRTRLRTDHQRIADIAASA